MECSIYQESSKRNVSAEYFLRQEFSIRNVFEKILLLKPWHEIPGGWDSFLAEHDFSDANYVIEEIKTVLGLYPIDDRMISATF
jgi:hypothetical protein